MIEKSFPSKKPIYTPPVLVKPTHNAYDQFLATQIGVDVPELLRRKNIISKLSNECSFMAGDTAYPASKEGYEMYGAVIIVNVVRTVKDLGVEYEWPQNDNPMLVTFRPVKGGNHIWCTTNYLTKRNFHMETCL